MFSKSYKKILSALLSVILLCSLNPDGTLFSNALSAPFAYETGLANDQEAPLLGTPLDYILYKSALYPMNTTYADTNNTWQYAGNTDGWTPSTTGNKRFPDYVLMQFDNKVIGTWFALELNVTAPGRYHTKLTYRVASQGAVTEMYFMPATTDIESCLTSGNLIGEVNYYASAGSGGHIAELSDVNVESAGKYYLIVRLKKLGKSGTGNYIYPSMFTLDGTQLESVSLSLNESLIGVGECTDSKVTGVLNNNNPADLSKASISYTSSNSSVATVDQNGKVTTVSEGDTDITATVTLGDVTRIDTKTIHVSNEYTLENVTLSGVDFLTQQMKAQFTLQGNLNNGDAIIISNSLATFSIVEEDPDGTVELLNGGGVVGRLVGNAKIKAVVSLRGKQFESNIISIPVTESVKSSSVYKFDFTGTNGDVRNLNYYSEVQNWAYFSDCVTASGTAVKQLTNCIQILSQLGEWVAFKAQIPKEGTYKTTLTYLGIRGAGTMNLYLLPVTQQTTANIGNYLTDVYLIDQIDGYNATSATMEKTLNNVYVPIAGEYFLVVKSADKGPENAYMYPAQLLLEGEHAIKSVSLTADSYSIEFGNKKQTVCSAIRVDGTAVDLTNGLSIIKYKSSDPLVASVDSNGTITANAPGNTEITASVSIDGVMVSDTKQITVTDSSDLLSIELTGVTNVLVGGTAQLQPKAKMASGNVLDVPPDTMTYTVVSCEPEGAAEIDENGLITGVKEGNIQVKATSTYLNKATETETLSIPILFSSKTKSTIWTQEKRDAVQENMKKYAWAESEVNSAIKAADVYVDQVDTLWNLVVPEGLPRYYHIGEKYDPEKWICPYCGVNLQSEYGSYPFLTDPLTDPWKIQCPACKCRFPSNDFESYYKSGLDEHGIFNKDLAKQNGQEYLKNLLYPEKGEGWGVDDGYGYFTGRTFDNGVVERRNYIAYYLHEGLWRGVIPTAINALALAYVYTGEAKYGRTGAILLDRVADFYPDYDWSLWKTFRDDNYPGKTMDCGWENANATKYAQAYDALFDIYNDPQVISFLSAKATQYKMDNPKNSAASIRKNVEDGILREIYRSCVNSNLAGNFGQTQAALTSAAVALDTMPETKDWINWMIYRAGEPYDNPRQGGDVLQTLVDDVDRDGNGNEAAPGYNKIWIDRMLDTAELLRNYTNSSVDLYNNPKFAKMFSAQVPLTMASYYTQQIGDTGSTASASLTLTINNMITGYRRLESPKLAQLAYLLNGNTVKGLHESITDKNPEKIQQDILNVIAKYGTFNLDSDMVTGYGFAALRDGAIYDSVDIDSAVNNQRDFSIYFGRGAGHGHNDCLELGIDAYGLNMAPDLGYPEQTGTQPNRMQWVRRTISHNTVVVDGRSQVAVLKQGHPIHFDNSNIVKLMDIDASLAYSQTDVYRRNVVMVKVNDDVSYGVDFFRIKGGNDHIYSFHSQSDEIHETEGLTLVPQVNENGEYIGTYAGADVPWGEDPQTDLVTGSEGNLKYLTGSTWLDAVRRDKTPQKTFTVDFKVKDFKHILPGNPNLHLRMTMLNDFNLSEVAIAHGTPPRIANNMKYMSYLEYVLVRRTGTNLDTLFTTVYEPYKDTRYLDSMTAVNTDIIEGTPGSTDMVKALKVTHKNGRIDYIVYATNNSVKYRIDNLFDFRGFVGVYILQNGAPIYTYLNDGDTIGDSSNILPAVTGVVDDFTRDLNLKNEITVTAEQQIDTSKLTGKYIYVDNTGSPENGAYKILGATASGNRIKLDIGDVTLIRAYKDVNNASSAGFAYNIESGQDFRIPLSTENDNTPVFLSTGEKNVDANSEISFTVSAESPVGKSLTYSAVALPRGASFDPVTHVFKWTPDSKQVGTHHIAIEATDGSLITTQHIKITVLTATSGADEQAIDTSSVETGTQTNTQTGTQTATNPVATASADKFVDLEGYDWAKDAIDSLVKTGVINGTSEKTFSPGANITRADFTVLLVRALNITSESSENFTDVSQNAYYADALAAAKGSGIIVGVGDNKYNPTAQISRQDIMVIINRALEKTGYKLVAADASALSGYNDVADISDYAKNAVAILVKNGIITGTDGSINPKGFANRAEVAVMLNRILEKIKQ